MKNLFYIYCKTMVYIVPCRAHSDQNFKFSQLWNFWHRVVL